jgi:hypothetical protein
LHHMQSLCLVVVQLRSNNQTDNSIIGRRADRQIDSHTDMYLAAILLQHVTMHFQADD